MRLPSDLHGKSEDRYPPEQSVLAICTVLHQLPVKLPVCLQCTRSGQQQFMQYTNTISGLPDLDSRCLHGCLGLLLACIWVILRTDFEQPPLIAPRTEQLAPAHYKQKVMDSQYLRHGRL